MVRLKCETLGKQVVVEPHYPEHAGQCLSLNLGVLALDLSQGVTQKQLGVLIHPASTATALPQFHMKIHCRQGAEKGLGHSGPKHRQMSTISWLLGRIPPSSCSTTRVCPGEEGHRGAQAPWQGSAGICCSRQGVLGRTLRRNEAEGPLPPL